MRENDLRKGAEVSSNEVVARVARATAKKMARQYGRHLESEVEAALFSVDNSEPPAQYIDPIAIGSLIVSVAALAYQVYSDHKKEKNRPTSDFIARTIKRQRSIEITDIELKVIDTVSAEIIEYGDDEGSQ